MDYQSLKIACPKCNDIDVGISEHFNIKGTTGEFIIYFCKQCGHTKWYYLGNRNKFQTDHPSEWAIYLPDENQSTLLENEIVKEHFQDDPSLEELEKRYIFYLLKKYDNNKSHVARTLRISRSTLREKIKKYMVT